ncbi:autotransporter assembly complex protein TamA [Succinimonas amylolytica]|uniref:autotransporter assembly complex protein TamA n=1 Tax=Succinimonas amylolytica TaxID=83769 RepID=UPI0023A7A612
MGLRFPVLLLTCIMPFVCFPALADSCGENCPPGQQESGSQDSVSPEARADESKITYLVKGLGGEIKENVEAYLSTLPDFRKVNFASSEEKILESVRNALKVFGYYSPKIELVFRKSTSAELTVKVSKGKPVFIRRSDIVVVGEALNDPLYMFGLSNIKLKSHTPFRHTDYEDVKSLLFSRALTMGYFDAHFISSSVIVNTDENTADIFLVLDSGHRYRYGKITFKGDSRYKDIIAPLITIKENDYFSMNRLSAMSGSLYDTGYFESAEVVPDISKSNNPENLDYVIPVDITLTRRKFNIVETGIGYATDEGLRGQVKWLMPLINEYGHSLNMQMKLSRIRQEALVRYTIPRKDPLKDYYYFQAQQAYDDLNDTNSTIFEASAHYFSKLGRNWQYDTYVAFHTEDYKQGMESGYAQITGIGSSMTYLKFFPMQDPREGQRYMIRAFGASEHVGSDVTFLQLTGQIRWLFSPTQNSRFLLRFDEGVNISHDTSKIPPSYRFFTGGDTTIRGFGYKTLSETFSNGTLKGGRYLSVASAEIQIPVIEDLRQTLFIDAGNAPDKFEEDEVYIGVGTGVRCVTKIGLIKLDLGFGVSETSIPFHLHFGIGPDL